MEIVKTIFKCAAIAVVLATVSVSANAQIFDTRNISVRLYDLDLNKPVDAKTLLNRVRNAARAACVRSGDSRDFQTVRERGACEYTSVTRTLAVISDRTGINVEQLAALAGEVPDVASN